MEKVRYAVIGLGWFGEYHADAIASLPNAELYALCTRTESRLNELADRFSVEHRYTDYRELLENTDIEAVTIATMWDQHTQPTLAALQSGKHVFLEKPMAATLEDCQLICEAARKAEGELMVGHICRFNPRYAAAKREVSAGSIGKIVAMAARRNIPARWTPEILNKIGPIVGDSVHCTDIMLWLTGAKIVSAFAQTVDVRGLKYPDIGQTMYRFDNGATATLEAVWCMPDGSPFDIDERLEVVGTDGVIHVQDTAPSFSLSTNEGWRSPDTTYWPEFNGVRRGALRDEFEYFTDCIQHDRQVSVITPEESMAAVAATLAAEQSAATGQVVYL